MIQTDKVEGAALRLLDEAEPVMHATGVGCVTVLASIGGLQYRMTVRRAGDGGDAGLTLDARDWEDCDGQGDDQQAAQGGVEEEKER